MARKGRPTTLATGNPLAAGPGKATAEAPRLGSPRGGLAPWAARPRWFTGSPGRQPLRVASPISAPPRLPLPGRRKVAGFTLIEVMVTLFLIGLLSTLAIVRLDAILGGFGEPDIGEALDQAVRMARYEAAERKEPVFLVYDPEQFAFVVSDRQGGTVAALKTAYGQADAVAVALLVEPPGQGRPDRRFGRPELVEVAALRFDPDRSAPAFTARWSAAGETGQARYDAFSPSLWPEEGR